jgi:tetratricopeptide (TPR) repeat protein
MRAFLSHSSADKELVIAVQAEFEADSTWLDRAEIEWGELFLEKLADGIAGSTDFVLFWSAAAARSEWVRIEINMAFIQALRRKAIRLRVVMLDDTPLPLYLEPYHVLSVSGSASPAADVVKHLLPVLTEPVRSARSPFVNRHEDIGRIEAAVDDSEVRVVWILGFSGIGKTSLVQEGLSRIFVGANIAHLQIGQGTGFVELALELRALSRRDILPEGLRQEQIEGDIRLSVELLAKNEQLLVLSNVQYWLSEDSEPEGPLPLLLSTAADLTAFAKRPMFLTSTRRPTISAAALSRQLLFRIAGLKDEHVATLVRNWYFSIYGRELTAENAKRIAPKLYGHPVAARLVAGLLGDRTVDFLEAYPQEIIALHRDLARVLLQGLKLTPEAERLMELLALAGVPLPASIIVSAGFSEDEFQRAVAICADAGLITADLAIETHPLFRDFFWHRLHRGSYQQVATQLAHALREHLDGLDKTSIEFVSLLPVAFRCYAMSGEIGEANKLRRDLSGELEAAAITLYGRRNYELADKYVEHLLDENPRNWRMRLYRARIRIRQEQWREAETLLEQMLAERPDDVGVLHVMGRSQLRQNHLREALELFTRVIARREHVASLRDAAECLHRLGRNQEALRFLERAKRRESEDPFVLDLESRILEDEGKLQPALEAALLASSRDPLNASMHNRLGIIRMKLGSPELSISHFKRAIDLDHDVFGPSNSLAAAYLDIGDIEAAEALLPELKARAKTPSNSNLVRHVEARIAFSKRNLDKSLEILKREIALGHNLVPNLGLLVSVQLAVFDENIRDFPSIAAVALEEGEVAFQRIVATDKSNEFIDRLRLQLEERKTGGLRASNKRIGSDRAHADTAPRLTGNSPPNLADSSDPLRRPVPGRPREKSGAVPPTPSRQSLPADTVDSSRGPRNPAQKPPLKPPFKPPTRSR